MLTQRINSVQFLAGGGEMGALTRAYDWASSPVGSPESWPQSLRAIVSMLLASRFPMFLWWGPELIQFYNDAYRPSLGNQGKHPTALGQCGQDCWPEIWPTIKPLIDQVLAGGEATWSENQLIPIYRNGRLEDVYWTFSYGPVLNEAGQVGGVLVVCQETTGVVTKEESRQQLLASFEQLPVAIAIISKTDLTFRMANPFYGQLVGRTPNELIGKPLLEALPEIRGQGFDQLLMEVIATGIPYIANEVAVNIIRRNQLETIYVDLAYQPQREIDERISGVLVVATDVTQQVLTRQKVEEAEESLRGAIELAELGTWQIDLTTGILDYSERLRKWFGIRPNEVITIERAYRPIRETDRPLVKAAILHAITPGTNGIYHVEYTLEAAETGQERILQAQGKAFFNEQGQAYKISGTVQEVTEQRQLQLALEQQVEQRTQQLQDLIQDLKRSNDNLQQFAYIASHDLQEPLRKIQSFGDILKTQYAAQLSEATTYLDRMQSAASRMSTLIKDLLTFSRISTRQEVSASVSLSEVAQAVVNDLELSIQEAGAVVEIAPLPTVQGDKSQLEQLFQNLLSNALKFRGVEVVPIIRISTRDVAASDLPSSVKPTRATTTYHRIDVSDNGIGFDEKYVDRIFQVFQRLHNKNEFAGTGIGLAICEKVVINHGGAIMASSKPSQGATFSIYLPI